MARDMYERFALLDTKLPRYDDLIRRTHKASAVSQRLEKIRSVGPMIATALIAAAGSATEFANGRRFSAWIVFTPRQHPSGPRQPLFVIPTHSNPHLHNLLIPAPT